MILSGLYEATLDRKVIERVQRNELNYVNQKTPNLYLKIHLLYAVLVGNLNLHHRNVKSNEPESEKRSAWDDIKALVAPFASQLQDVKSEDGNSTQIRLKGMLGCQASFGAAIGAPVVFFLGSFFFSVFSDLSAIGDNDTSHALAFGMWWMTIPHVAIVAGCLLAGNNPNTLEVIVCGLSSWQSKRAIVLHPAKGTLEKVRRWIDSTIGLTLFVRTDSRTHFWHYLNLYRPFYNSVYQPVWMWERGRSKRTWIRRVQTEFDELILSDGKKSQKSAEKNVRYEKILTDNFSLGLVDWVYIIVVTLALMATPFILAFLTSFYTPTVGLSCRTFTFLMYLVFQILISLIWLWDFQFEERSPLTQEMKLLSGKSIQVPSSYCVVMTLGLVGSAFTTIAGTFLQILGVYRNCLCSIPISAWSSGDYDIVVSTNSADDIKYAEHFWLPTGITSIVVLIGVCYIGWWYQRHWRRRFTVVIDKYPWQDEQPSNGDPMSTKNQPDFNKKRPTVMVRSMTGENGTENYDEITRG